uniref:Histidine-rich glycoprotein n=1 Tax=Solanum tuberosum TaxID=4113 RepID=M1DUX7_SOLTU
MSSIASDPCDYDMGDYDCDDEGYGCEDNNDYEGYDDSHDQESNENESYYSRGEYERNVEHSSYGEDRGEEDFCGSSYDDDGACERSYSHSESEDGSYDDAGTCNTSHYQDKGTSMKNGGTQVPTKEPTLEGVMDALMGCSNIQGKEDLSCGRQGTIANLNTFTIANEQSNVDTLVDPIDDRIDSSSKIDLCPLSVDTYALNASSLFCNDCVDQHVSECSSLVEGSFNVIKKTQFGGTNDNVDH